MLHMNSNFACTCIAGLFPLTHKTEHSTSFMYVQVLCIGVHNII